MAVYGETSRTRLYSAVAPVRHDDVPVDVHGHSSGSVELTVAFTVGAKFQQKFPFSVEHLHNNEETHYHPTPLCAVILQRRLLSFSTYLDRVVVEVCHNDFIVAVDGSKVGTLTAGQEVGAEVKVRVIEAEWKEMHARSARKGIKDDHVMP